MLYIFIIHSYIQKIEEGQGNLQSKVKILTYKTPKEKECVLFILILCYLYS